VQNPDEEEELVELESETMFLEILKALRDLPRPMWCILLITTLTWLATFPILFFGMD
jgi:solute carrier family 45 protein 1/2/4